MALETTGVSCLRRGCSRSVATAVTSSNINTKGWRERSARLHSIESIARKFASSRMSSRLAGMPPRPGTALWASLANVLDFLAPPTFCWLLGIHLHLYPKHVKIDHFQLG